MSASAKVLDFIYTVIERTAAQAYLMGRRDEAAGAAHKTEDFKLGRGNRLTIKTALEKHLKSR